MIRGIWLSGQSDLTEAMDVRMEVFVEEQGFSREAEPVSYTHLYEAAVEAVQQENITLLDQPAERVVCYMDPEEFRSTWLANKAIYRTRMAIADGGELIVLAPGIRMFGEDEALNGLIERYGYRGTEGVSYTHLFDSI